MLFLLFTKAENFRFVLLDFLPLTQIMNQDQPASTELTIKTPITLETIPEDVAEIIAAKIKAWAKVEGDLEQREKARK